MSYEHAKKLVQDAGLIHENDGHPDIHYRKIAQLYMDWWNLESERLARLEKEDSV
tara:strand:+ start:122 stop:286 length:165 start_codon:yes stop_codon:yes gene_type:complete